MNLIKLLFAHLAKATPSLNYQDLGDLVLAGDFTGLASTNSSQLTAPPQTNDDLIFYNANNNTWTQTPFIDGSIHAACHIPNQQTYFVAGNFSKIFGQSIDGGLAIVNVSSNSAASISSTNITGDSVQVLWCNSTNIYVGGSFALNSGYGVATWKNNQWELPKFQGFDENAEVNSIVQYGDNMIFGGNFSWEPNSVNLTDSEGNELQPGVQLVSLRAANATGYAYEGAEGESADNALCPKSGKGGWQSGPNSLTGYVDVALAYTSYLSKIRIYNMQGSATKTFRLYSYPAAGIMNLTYVDSNNQLQSCTAECPLPEDQGSKGYTDFTFVNYIPSDKLRLQLTDYYASNAGIDGISLFQSGQIIYANNEFNKARDCSSSESEVNAQTASASTDGSGWEVMGDYLQTRITDKTTFNEFKATFNPWFTEFTKGAGLYQVNLYTPGCAKSGSCAQRGAVNVTIYPGYGEPQYTTVYQTNEEEKYDVIFDGKITSGAYFQLTPDASSPLPMNFVAYKVNMYFKKQVSDIQLRNLFEFDASNFTSSETTSDMIGLTPVNNLAANTSEHSLVSSLVLKDSDLYVSGSNFPQNFTDSSNFMLSLDSGSLTNLDGADEMDLFEVDGNILGVDGEYTYLLENSEFTSLDVSPAESVVSLPFNNTDYLALFSNDDVYFLEDQKVTKTSIKGHLNFPAKMDNQTVYIGSLQMFDVYTQSNAILATNDQLNSFSSGIQSQIKDGMFINEDSGLVVGDFGVQLFNNTDLSSLSVPSSFNKSGSVNSVDVANSSLAAFGGSNGVLLYDLESDSNVKQPSVQGNVSTVAFQPNGTILAIGGSTDNVLDLFDVSQSKSVKSGLDFESKDYINDLVFANTNQLVIAGSLNNSQSQVMVYNFHNSSANALPALPGPVTNIAILPGNDTQLVATGTNDDSIFVQKYANGQWTSISHNLTNDSVISKLAIVPLNSGSALALVGKFELSDSTSSSLMVLNDNNLSPIFSTNGMLSTIFSSKTGKLKGSSSDTYTKPSTEPKPTKPTTERKYRPVGHVVGISCGIGIACTLLISLIYLGIEFTINHSKTTVPYQNLDQKSFEDGMKGTKIVK